MKASKFTDTQKAFILKQGNDGVPVADTAAAICAPWRSASRLLTTRFA
jgi:hypothetical protein